MSEERLPIEDIPATLICPICEFGPAKNTLGFRAHMANKHSLKYQTKTQPGTKSAFAKDKKLREYREMEDPNTLPPWIKIGLARKVIYGTSFTAAAKSMGKEKNSLYNYGKSPAGIKYMEEIKAQVDDPRNVVRNLIDASTLKVFDYAMLALDWAVEARDYSAVHRFAKDIGLKSILEEDENKQLQGAVIQINLGANDMAQHIPETSYEIIDAGE